jgi:hypothetical protein
MKRPAKENPETEEVVSPVIGVTFEGRIKIVSSNVTWNMNPAAARWLSKELAEAADRAERQVKPDKT